MIIISILNRNLTMFVVRAMRVFMFFILFIFFAVFIFLFLLVFVFLSSERQFSKHPLHHCLLSASRVGAMILIEERGTIKRFQDDSSLQPHTIIRPPSSLFFWPSHTANPTNTQNAPSMRKYPQHECHHCTDLPLSVMSS